MLPNKNELFKSRDFEDQIIWVNMIRDFAEITFCGYLLYL